LNQFSKFGNTPVKITVDRQKTRYFNKLAVFQNFPAEIAIATAAVQNIVRTSRATSLTDACKAFERSCALP
jgi:hypothetical protein